jgi:hypothetical protein
MTNEASSAPLPLPHFDRRTRPLLLLARGRIVEPLLACGRRAAVTTAYDEKCIDRFDCTKEELEAFFGRSYIYVIDSRALQSEEFWKQIESFVGHTFVLYGRATI